MHLFWSSTQRPQTGPEPQPVSTAKGCTYVIALYGLSTTVLGKSEQTFLSEAVPTNTFCAGAAVQALLFFFSCTSHDFSLSMQSTTLLMELLLY